MIDVRDVVRAFALAGESVQQAPSAFADIGTGICTDMGDFAAMIAKALRLTLRVELERLPSFEAVSTKADLGRGGELGWAPEIPIGKSVQDFAEWYKQVVR
jgi:nucleoside-diphosphate-sugar epimerase